MKYFLCGILFLLSSKLGALDYSELFISEQLLIGKVKIMPGEEIGLHRDAHSQIETVA